MGLDPKHPDYEPGNQCNVCKDILFAGVTPKYVEADVSGINPCPGIEDPAPNGTFLLTQGVNPCFWQYTTNGLFINWELRIDRSILSIGVLGLWWFRAIVEDTCFDAFVNVNVCGEGPVIGENGYVLLYWGPTIGP